MMDIPILGIVENYSYIVCPDCNKKIKVFGESKVNEKAKQHDIKHVISLPIDPKIATLCDEGKIEKFDETYFDELIKDVFNK